MENDVIRVSTFDKLYDYQNGRKCDICGKTINLGLPFSRGMEVSYISEKLLHKDTNWTTPVRHILYTHQGSCETMAVLQVSNEYMG